MIVIVLFSPIHFFSIFSHLRIFIYKSKTIKFSIQREIIITSLLNKLTKVLINDFKIDIIGISIRLEIKRGYFFFFFSVKDRNLFHRVDTIGNIFTSGKATSENITGGVHEMK